MANSDTIIAYVKELLEGKPDIKAAALSGSYGRGDQDEFSDFDFNAFVSTPEIADQAFNAVRAEIEKNPQIVFSKVIPYSKTINAVTEDWERIDITFIDAEKASKMSQQGLKFVFDKDNVADSLKKEPVLLPRNKAEIQGTVDEFLRVLGLLPVVIGRNDYVVGQTGAQLLREMLVKIMMQESFDGVIRGVLSARKSLTDEQYKILENVPPIKSERESLLKSYKYIANEFFVRGKKLVHEQGLTWPTRFEEATRQNLQTKLGLTI